MNRGFRQIALLLIFVFLANVQAWALTVEGETHHDSSVNTQLIIQSSENLQHECHDCDQDDHYHYHCHAIDHLQGQVSDGFTLSKLSKDPNLFLTGSVNATSTHPEDIYRPPRLPSLT